jgi:hypothetical protein
MSVGQPFGTISEFDLTGDLLGTFTVTRPTSASAHLP